jgi:hypothetical protein
MLSQASAGGVATGVGDAQLNAPRERGGPGALASSIRHSGGPQALALMRALQKGGGFDSLGLT